MYAPILDEGYDSGRARLGNSQPLWSDGIATVYLVAFRTPEGLIIDLRLVIEQPTSQAATAIVAA